MAKDASVDKPESKEKIMCGCKFSTWIKMVNCVLGALIAFYGVFSFFEVPLGNGEIVIAYSFKVYEILFGTLLFISFCDFNFIMKHFKFLKTVSGKGFFNLFLCSMFLVGNDGSIGGYIMTGAIGFCGVFFVLVGCACVKTDEPMEKDFSKDSVLKSRKTGDN